MLESELFALLEHTADAAYTVTNEGEICSWNAAAERLFGYSAAAVLRRNIDDLFGDTYRYEAPAEDSYPGDCTNGCVRQQVRDHFTIYDRKTS